MTADSFPMLTAIEPVRHETIQSRIHADLKMMLMTGRFLPGQALKINDLAAAFGTSAQPIRESIRQLIAERALDTVANRSARVPSMDGEQFEDLRRTRIALECLASELACQRATAEGIERLQAIVDAEINADDGNDILGSISRNLDFHFTLYGMSGSTVLPPIIEGLWLRMGPHVRAAAENFDASQGRGAKLHLRLLEALRAGDAHRAREAMADDINRTFDLLQGKPVSQEG